MPALTKYSHAFNELLAQMLRRAPQLRPSAEELLGHPYLVRAHGDDSSKSREQLIKELQAERARAFQLEQYGRAHPARHSPPNRQLQALLAEPAGAPKPKSMLRRADSVPYAPAEWAQALLEA